MEDAMFSAKDREEQQDYLGQDGLLYCGKCHFPKQKRLAWGPEGSPPTLVPVACQCQQQQQHQHRGGSRQAEQRVPKSLAVHLPRNDSGDQKAHRIDPNGQQPGAGHGGVQQKGQYQQHDKPPPSI